MDCSLTTESVESDKEVDKDQKCSKGGESKPETQTTPSCALQSVKTLLFLAQFGLFTSSSGQHLMRYLQSTVS